MAETKKKGRSGTKRNQNSTSEQVQTLRERMRAFGQSSARNTCQACPEGPQKVIYLTFDDGPEPGTVEIFEALKSVNVPATFFFVGENVLATESGEFSKLFPNAGLSPGLFREIFLHPSFHVGNHSQTQSHQFYQSYYETGLRVDSNTYRPSATSEDFGRRSVLVDFELAGMAMSYALFNRSDIYPSEMKKISDYGYRGASVTSYFDSRGVIPYFPVHPSRLPGTNRWRLPNKDDEVTDWRGPDRDDEADDLADNGYLIYGWDLEWEFSGDGSDMSDDVRKEFLDGLNGWWAYYGENKEKDRLSQSVDTMVDSVSDALDYFWDGTRFESSNDRQVVILMHDRQFRSPDPESEENEYIDQLLEFVAKCKAKGYVFDVLENYQT
jgi:peptidoglycan/xylan/chitin deacetylase (PgdA/CDA1 family)